MALRSKKDAAEARLGALIRKIRKASGISQETLAEKIGISYQQIQKYEYGLTSITVTRLRQIASALDVPIEAFFGEEGSTHFDPEETRVLSAFRKIRADKFRRAAIDMLGTIERLSSNVY